MVLGFAVYVRLGARQASQWGKELEDLEKSITDVVMESRFPFLREAARKQMVAAAVDGLSAETAGGTLIWWK